MLITPVQSMDDGYLGIQDGRIKTILDAEQRGYIRHMRLPPGTCVNAALLENVFVILVCVLNFFLPVFVVGKPGCFKTLSVSLVTSALRGRDSTDPFFTLFPQSSPCPSKAPLRQRRGG